MTMPQISRETMKAAGTELFQMSAFRWREWSALVAIAVVGSCLYGASLGLVLRDWRSGPAALWLAVSAGAAWCVFIPVLWRASQQPLLECFDRCLVTMACGEVVLTSGALVNVLLWSAAVLENAAAINATIVAVSNVTMFIILAIQMQGAGMPVRKVLALWLLGLNGSGAVFFWLLYRILHNA